VRIGRPKAQVVRRESRRPQEESFARGRPLPSALRARGSCCTAWQASRTTRSPPARRSGWFPRPTVPQIVNRSRADDGSASIRSRPLNVGMINYGRTGMGRGGIVNFSEAKIGSSACVCRWFACCSWIACFAHQKRVFYSSHLRQPHRICCAVHEAQGVAISNPAASTNTNRPQRRSSRRGCRQMLEFEQSTVGLLKTVVDLPLYTPRYLEESSAWRSIRVLRNLKKPP